MYAHSINAPHLFASFHTIFLVIYALLFGLFSIILEFFLFVDTL